MTSCAAIRRHPFMAYACAAWLAISGLVFVDDARAQDRQGEREPSARKKTARAKARAAKTSGGKGMAQRSPEETPVATAAAGEARSTGKAEATRASADASDADVRKEGDTEVKVMEFSGLDIEGQLKTPQMLYFLNRLRAEFGRPDLPHRSFIPELQRGASEKAF